MASGFEFRADSTFQFFYTYGASDRFATGTWSAHGDTIRLKSRKEAGRDFKVEKQSKKGKEYQIRIVDKNPILIDGVRCFAFSGARKELFESSRNGEITIPWATCDTLYLQHPYFPDIATLIKDVKNNNRSFEVSLSPTLMEVSFKSILFWKNGDGSLGCHPNYFMPMENIRYKKLE